MRVATLRKHPTDQSFVLLAVGPDLNSLMGRFEPARLSVQHHGYIVHVDDVDNLGRFLRINNVAVADERKNISTATAPKFNRDPFTCLKCYDCDHTQRECDPICGGCGHCHNCGGQSLGRYTIEPDEQREINKRGAAKVRSLLSTWPRRIDDTPQPAEPALAEARHTTTEETP